MDSRPGYGTLLGRIRTNVRTYIRKQLELPRQEISEIVRANLRAVRWFGIAAALALFFVVGLTVLIIALVALVLPLWASALIVTLVFGIAAGITGYTGYKKLELHGPQRSITSFKETVAWAKARLRGRTAS